MLRRLIPIAIASLCSTSAIAGMKLGVNTHFDQGWRLAALDKVTQSQAQGIRDTVTWGKVEQQPGVYTFTDKNSGHMPDACKRSMPVLLVLSPRNKIYDGGMAVVSDTGRKAFARYVRALVDRFPCINGIEVGNEINAPSRKWPGPSEKPAAYVAILKDVRAALNAQPRRVALIGGSSLSVAVGFLDTLFAAGMLPLVDGVAVHPYADTPEQLPLQFERLKRAMARHGQVKPIWATEFGLYYKTPEAAPPHAIKVMTVMSAAGVRYAHWYALLDEQWYPNMGLFAGRNPKPALATFQFAVQRLLSAGTARRIDAGDPLTFIYRFGNGPYIMWGSGRSISLNGGATAFNAKGENITIPTALGPDPIVVAASDYKLGSPTVLADTLFDVGQAPWSAFVRPKAGKPMQMRWIDWNWASYFGLSGASNFKATPAAVSLGAAGAKPWSLVERYTSPIARKLWLSACFASGKMGTAYIRIAKGKHELYAGTADGMRQPPLIAVALAAGESVDVSYVAATKGPPVLVRRRIRVLANPDHAPALCPPTPSQKLE